MSNCQKSELLYAKPYIHPNHGEVFSVIGFGEKPFDTKELCQHMVINPEAYDRLQAIRKRANEVHKELVENIRLEIEMFQDNINELFKNKENLNGDYFQVETLARGLVKANILDVLQEVAGQECGGENHLLQVAARESVKRGILKYADPDRPEPDRSEDEAEAEKAYSEDQKVEFNKFLDAVFGGLLRK